MEAASLETLKQELSISQEDMEQWVRDVEQWAATERHGGHSSLEELQREIDEIIYSLRKKKHDLYRQNDSNQTRQRKRRRLSELKRKLRERIMHYNSVAAHGEKIALEEVCSLSEDAILPWEAQGDVVSLRLKRRVFDQVMLVRRMEEEKIIIVKEMTQHCQYLRKALDNMDSLLRQTKEDIQNHTSLGELSEEGHHGLYCCLLHKRHILQQKLSTVTCTYAPVDTHPSVIFEEDMEDCEEESEQEDSTHEFSDEEL